MKNFSVALFFGDRVAYLALGGNVRILPDCCQVTYNPCLALKTTEKIAKELLKEVKEKLPDVKSSVVEF